MFYLFPVCPTNYNNILIVGWLLPSQLFKHKNSNTGHFGIHRNDKIPFTLQPETQNKNNFLNNHQGKTHDSAVKI